MSAAPSFRAHAVAANFSPRADIFAAAALDTSQARSIRIDPVEGRAIPSRPQPLHGESAMSEPTTANSLFVQPASEVTPCAYEWLWPGRFALGKLSILDGDPGLGKSLLALDLCARLSRGRAMPDGNAGPSAAAALFINGEDQNEDTTVPRLQALGADLPRVYVIRATQGTMRPFRMPSQIGMLAEALDRTGARLVVIDPLMAFLDPSVQVMSDPSVRAALDPVKGLAEQRGCTVLFIRHLNKTLRARALYRGLSSIAFTGLCRSSWLVGPDPEQPARTIFAQLKNNLAPAQTSLAYELVRHEGRPPELVWLGSSSYAAETVLKPPRLGAAETRTLRAAQFLQSFLAGGPKPSHEIWKAAEKEGFARRTLQRAMKRSGIKTKAFSDDGITRRYWLLEGQTMPAGLTDPLEAVGLADFAERYPGSTPIDDL
jgi:hypothetical protein